jgi:hypothetical protein
MHLWGHSSFDELRGTAYHEAGHALAAHMFGFPVEKATVVPAPGNYLGGIWLTNPDVRNSTKGIVYCLAGLSAENKLLGGVMGGVGSCEPDIRKAVEGLKELREHARVTKRAVPSSTELIERADRLVLKYRKPITDLAGMLMASGTLSGAEVHEILQRAIDPPVPQPVAKRAKPTMRSPLFEREQPNDTFAKRINNFSTDLWLAKGYPEYDDNQPRDSGGRWSGGGGGGGSGAHGGGTGRNWQRAAQLAGMAAFGLVAVGSTAVAVRTGNAQAALHLATHGRGMLSAAAQIKGTRISRSLLESSAYNLSNVRSYVGTLPMEWELARRFQGMQTFVRHGTDPTTGLTGTILSVRSRAATVEAVQGGVVPANVFIGEAVLSESASLGRTLMVGNLYAPATAAGALFTREYMNTVMRTAIASRVDSIRTFAGSSMGGYLWPQRGFELANPTSEVAQILRRTVATRAGQMLDGKAITKTQYDEIAGIVSTWGKDVPTRLAHMDSKVAVGGLKLKDFPELGAVRGDMTIGKALLAGTNGFYVLPRVKYEALVTITKSASEPIAKRAKPTLADRISQSATGAFF